jgi:cystathionine beta-lyase/cystathionine gamma-synthase
VKAPALAPKQERHAPARLSDAFLDASFQDLSEDFAGLKWIAGSMLDRLGTATRELRAARRHLHPEAFDEVLEGIRRLRERYAETLQELDILRKSAAVRRSPGRLAALTERKRAIALVLRSRQAVGAALATATDWQSPSFLHAVHSCAGRRTGRVLEHVDDYTRDRHPDAKAFEAAYVAEYVDAPDKRDLHAFMTSCGMSAFTTIIGALAADGCLRRPAVFGRSTYHECRDIIRRSWGRRAVAVDERSVPAILEAVRLLRPSALFLDLMCNAKGQAVPDIAAVIRSLAREAIAGGAPRVVIDTTGLSCAARPFATLPANARRPVVIAFESLTKYAQLGMDRAPAGMVVVRGARLAAAMSDSREHLGTNVSDAGAWLVPWPNHDILTQRLRRLARNATVLARRLDEQAVEASSGRFAGVTYPGLPQHPSFDAAARQGFPGGFLSIDIRPEEDVVVEGSRLLRGLLDEAAAAGVPLAAGASFGFDVTRVYLTASNAASGAPFVRVAAGTEHRLGMEMLAGVFARAIERWSR